MSGKCVRARAIVFERHSESWENSTRGGSVCGEMTVLEIQETQQLCGRRIAMLAAFQKQLKYCAVGSHESPKPTVSKTAFWPELENILGACCNSADMEQRSLFVFGLTPIKEPMEPCPDHLTDLTSYSLNMLPAFDCNSS